LGMLQLSGATVLASALSVDPAQGIAVPLQVIVESPSHWGKNKVSS